MKKISLYLILILFFSCMTTVEDYDISLDTLILEEIEENIEKSELFKVFQLLTYYENRTEDSTFLETSRSNLNSLLPKKLNEHFVNEDWNNFFLTYNNLKSLDFDLNVYNYNQILYKYITKNTEKTLLKSGVLLGESKLNYKKLTDEELINLSDIYNKVSPIKDFDKLNRELISRKLPDLKEGNTGNYIDGVITIFVNKGISFNEGIGSRDIVVGSGFFIDKLGYAVTNYHVIESMVDPDYEGLSNLYVKLNGSIDKVPAKVIGWDPVLDLALIKVSAIPTYVYSFSSNDKLMIGEKVTALGSPGGLGSTVTSGIVSAINRSLLELGSVIQIDSPINPGNSGGPLIDSEYKVSNVVFAGIEEFEGVNFAIPIRYLKENLKSMYYGGQVKHVWLGAGVVYRKKQLEIVYIKPGSPAYYLGLEKNDKIKSINGKEFSSITQIQDYLMGFSPLEIIDFQFIRDGKVIDKKICLDERPDIAMESIINGDTSDHLYIPLFGMDIKFTGKILWNKEYLINDVFPGTIADELDLLPGDIIEVKSWEYNDEFKVVILQFIIQSQKEGFWEKSIQIVAPINVNFFI